MPMANDENVLLDTRISVFWKFVVVSLSIFGITVALNQAFSWRLGGHVILTNSYLFLVLAAFLPIVFIVRPISKSFSNKPVTIFDAALALSALSVNIYFAINGERIITEGWTYTAPAAAAFCAFVLWGLVLESLRRTAGLVVTIIALSFSLYPIIAADIPIEFLQGVPFGIRTTAQFHTMGVDSIIGLPLQTAGSVLVGFLVFGVALQHTGGATFFYDIAQSFFGKYRGGSAKVSVVSSALMGMMSGSAVSNVLTTGPMTIPAMIKSGMAARYAAAVEATASTGGTITPPIMGTAAFLMVSFIGVPYSDVVIAAAIPAMLYYLGIFVQIDANSEKSGLEGLDKGALENAGVVALRGLPYIIALVGLIFLLVFKKNEAQAPYLVVAFLLIFALFSRRQRFGVQSLIEFLYASGATVAQITGIIAGVGLIVGGLSMTGVSLSLARELVHMMGSNEILILIAGAIASFVLGMGMTVSAVYVFLAVVLTPALTQMGFNPIAAHLFVIYWATVSYITPPVALAAFAAAGIAKSPPMPTALTAMRLGSVKYVMPFAFVFNPALVAQEASLLEIGSALFFAVLGVFFLGCSFEGWLVIVRRSLNWLLRVLFFVAGCAMFFPHITINIIGLVSAMLLAAYTRFGVSTPRPTPG